VNDGDSATHVDLGWRRRVGGGAWVAALEAMWPRQLPLHSGVCRQQIQQLGDSLVGLVASAVPLGIGGRSSKLRRHRRPVTASTKMGGTAWQAFRSRLFPSPSLVSGTNGRKSSLTILVGADSVDTLGVSFPC
jgi:hypothetical protein